MRASRNDSPLDAGFKEPGHTALGHGGGALVQEQIDVDRTGLGHLEAGARQILRVQAAKFGVNHVIYALNGLGWASGHRVNNRVGHMVRAAPCRDFRGRCVKEPLDQVTVIGGVAKTDRQGNRSLRVTAPAGQAFDVEDASEEH